MAKRRIWARNNKQKDDIFAIYIENTFKPCVLHSAPLPGPMNNEMEEILPVTPKEVANEIKRNMSPKKASGFDLITDEILKQVPRKGIVMLIYRINGVFRKENVPSM